MTKVAGMRPETAYGYAVRPTTGGGTIVEYPDIPGCFGEGETEPEAIANAKMALARWLQNAAELGIKPPEPGSRRVLTEHFRIRVPRTVHRRIALLANEVELSFNETVVQLIYKAVGRDFGQAIGTGLCTVLGQGGLATRKPKRPRFDPAGEYSGNWLQRIPETLHHQIVVWARSEGVSLNLLVAYILTRELERWGQEVGEESKAA